MIRLPHPMNPQQLLDTASRIAASSDDEGDGADAASGFGSDDEADDEDAVSDGEDSAGEVYFTRRTIVPRGADERHWTTPPRRAPNALQIARASPRRPATPRPRSMPPPAALTPMVLPPPATQSSSDQWGGATTSLSAGLVSATWFICGAAIGHEWPGRFVYILGLWHFNRPWLLPLRHPQCWRPVTMVVVGVQYLESPSRRSFFSATLEGRRFRGSPHRRANRSGCIVFPPTHVFP